MSNRRENSRRAVDKIAQLTMDKTVETQSDLIKKLQCLLAEAADKLEGDDEYAKNLIKRIDEVLPQ